MCLKTGMYICFFWSIVGSDYCCVSLYIAFAVFLAHKTYQIKYTKNISLFSLVRVYFYFLSDCPQTRGLKAALVSERHPQPGLGLGFGVRVRVPLVICLQKTCRSTKNLYLFIFFMHYSVFGAFSCMFCGLRDW